MRYLLFILALAWPCLAGIEFVAASNHYVTCGNVGNLGTNDYSITAWFKSTAATDQIILSKFVGAGPYWFLFVTGGSTLQANRLISAGNANAWAATQAYNDGNWHHIAMTWDVSTETAVIYFNGADASATSVSDVGDSTGSADNSAPLVIGAADGPVSLFDGSLADVRLYIGKILTAEEVKIIYEHRGSDTIIGSLAGRWKLDEKPQGTTASGASSVIDISANGYHGTPTNSPTYKAAPLRIR